MIVVSSAAIRTPSAASKFPVLTSSTNPPIAPCPAAPTCWAAGGRSWGASRRLGRAPQTAEGRQWRRSADAPLRWDGNALRASTHHGTLVMKHGVVKDGKGNVALVTTSGAAVAAARMGR
jgi:hypothetical protein